MFDKVSFMKVHIEITTCLRLNL